MNSGQNGYGYGQQNNGAPVPPSGQYYQGSPQYPGAQAQSQTGQQSAPYTQRTSSQNDSNGNSQKPPKQKKTPGLGAVFAVAFCGALLACGLALGGFTAFNAIQKAATPTTSKEATAPQSTTLGNQNPTTIEITGEDHTLAEVVAAKVLPSVVCIYVYSGSSSYGGVSNTSSLTESALGSGIVLTEDGYVLTNYHVIEGGSAFKVSVQGESCDAELVGTDASSDLAVIKIKNVSGLVAADIGDSDDLTIGEWVMSIGSPFGFEQSVATGVVSATSRSDIMEIESTGYGQSEIAIYPNMIQTDAAINPGNSGGALVDSNGQVIGVNTLISSASGGYSGVGFAIPINYAIALAEQMIAGETPSHAQLGVSLSTVNSSNAHRYNLSSSSGAYVAGVTEGSGADAAGIKAGDIIVGFAGKTITSASDLMVAIREHQIGETVDVVVNRDGIEKTFQVTLGSDTDTARTTRSSSRFQ